VRLRYIAARTGVTDRTEAGDVVKHQDGRRNRCQIQAHVPLYETDTREQRQQQAPWLRRAQLRRGRRGAALAGQC
jgi:hypothetical protein